MFCTTWAIDTYLRYVGNNKLNVVSTKLFDLENIVLCIINIETCVSFAKNKVYGFFHVFLRVFLVRASWG